MPRDPVRVAAVTDPLATAWARFAVDCARTAAPEATYQAWFAHYLMNEFGVLRVVREVDFGAKYLLEDSDRDRFRGHNLMTDVMVLREPAVDLPRRAWLAKKDAPDAHLRSGLGRLGLFEVVCEMKVGSSQGEGLDPSAIVLDGHKLDALARAARETYEDHRVPRLVVCVLDNHPTRRLGVASLRERWAAEFPDGRVELLLDSIHSPTGSVPVET